MKQPDAIRVSGSTFSLIWQFVRPLQNRMLLSLVLILISRAAGLVVPYAPKVVIDRIVAGHEDNLLWPLFAILSLSVLLQAGTSFVLSQILSLEGQKLITELRRKVQAHVIRLPVSYFDSNNSGALVTRTMNDVRGMRNLVGQGFIELVGGIITAAFVLVILFQISAVLTLITVAFLATLSGFLNWAFGAIRPLFRESAKLSSIVSGRLLESYSGIRVVKGYRAEAREDRVFAGGTQRLLENAKRLVTLGSITSSLVILDVRLLSAVILCVGSSQVLQHTLTVGSLVSYLLYLNLVIQPITQAASVGADLSETIAGLDRTRELLAEQSETQGDEERTVRLKSLSGTVEFQNVSFQYEPGKPVLEGLNFDAQPGTMTALVGSSGSGKSTIIGLVAAFYRATAGQVLIDGVDINRISLGAFRSALGMVLQESFLFDGTIRQNILLPRPDATEDEFAHACRIAHVAEFAERFDKKYECVIGERGVRLSAGQRQRISIARAIIANPRILILDEATSNLDAESEMLIQNGLLHLMNGRTTFVIAHRLSTAQAADQVLVVEGGRIVERGTHATLFASKGRYFDLYTRQHRTEADLIPGIVDVEDRLKESKRKRVVADHAGLEEIVGNSLSEIL